MTSTVYNCLLLNKVTKIFNSILNSIYKLATTDLIILKFFLEVGLNSKLLFVYIAANVERSKSVV